MLRIFDWLRQRGRHSRRATGFTERTNDEQYAALARGDEIQPPWVWLPTSDPSWGHWRQGGHEAWLHSIWLRYMLGLDVVQQQDYMDKWEAPEEWRAFLWGRTARPS